MLRSSTGTSLVSAGATTTGTAMADGPLFCGGSDEVALSEQPLSATAHTASIEHHSTRIHAVGQEITEETESSLFCGFISRGWVRGVCACSVGWPCVFSLALRAPNFGLAFLPGTPRRTFAGSPFVAAESARLKPIAP